MNSCARNEALASGTICVDLDDAGRTPDWVLADVFAGRGAETLALAKEFQVRVADMFREQRWPRASSSSTLLNIGC